MISSHRRIAVTIAESSSSTYKAQSGHSEPAELDFELARMLGRASCLSVDECGADHSGQSLFLLHTSDGRVVGHGEEERTKQSVRDCAEGKKDGVIKVPRFEFGGVPHAGQPSSWLILESASSAEEAFVYLIR